MPPKDVYDNIMVHNTMKQYIRFADKKGYHKHAVHVPAINRWVYCVDNPQSVSQFQRAIQEPDVHRPKGNPKKVHRETVYARLDKIEERQFILEKLPKTRSFRYLDRLFPDTKSLDPPQRLQRRIRCLNRTLYRPHLFQLYYYLDYLLTLLTRGKLSKEEKDSLLLKVLGLPCPPFLIRNESSGLVKYP